MINLTKFLVQISAEIEEQLSHLLPEIKGEARVLAEAMRYSALGGGKRLRPALFCATIKAFGGDYHPYLPYAAALEMIHCYSLIHDDLPAMDDDQLRRGKPTVHIAYGEAMAILAGDSLLSLAAEILARPLPDINPRYQLAAAMEMMADAGKMVEGQAIEIISSSEIISPELLQTIYEGKTAALFKAAAKGAACLIGVTEEQQAALSQYCTWLGLAFQIADDMLDIQGEAAATGKSRGRDAKNNKQTYPAIFGCQRAEQEAQKAVREAKAALSKLNIDIDILYSFADYSISRKN